MRFAYFQLGTLPQILNQKSLQSLAPLFFSSKHISTHVCPMPQLLGSPTLSRKMILN